MFDEDFAVEEQFDVAKQGGGMHDDRQSSSRMLGGLVLTAMLQPVLAAWLFFQGYSVFQILMIVWLLGSFFFVGLLIVADLVSEWRASKNENTAAARSQSFERFVNRLNDPAAAPVQPRRAPGYGVAARIADQAQLLRSRERLQNKPRLALVSSSWRH